MTCAVCGTVTVPGARFCHNCGAPVTTVAQPAAERRVVTVLFGDLSDFTAWAEGEDPERVGAVTDRVLAALASAVTTFGGHVDKLTGDGIMAVFGAPVAHEDDPERAVRAALAMQRSVRHVLDDERSGGAPSGLRLGVNTGDVVAGVQAAIEYTVIGDTVNTAARLADAAAVGSVYAGAATTAATRHLASWQRLTPLRLKGKRRPVEAYELLGLLDAPGTRSGLGAEGPFLGREAEQALVASRLDEVIDAGQPQVIIFTGEAGLGKSRIAAEAARHAVSGGTRVLSVRCAAYGERWRLGPLADLVRAAIGLADRGGVPATRAQATERIRRVAAGASVLATNPPTQTLLTLLGLGGEAADAPTRGVGEGPYDSEGRFGMPSRFGGELPRPDRSEAETKSAPAAVASLLSALAGQSPLLVIVDDLQDASAQTIDALGSALAALSGPVLVLLFGRPETVRTAGALTRLASAEVHALAPLRGAESSRLLHAYLGGGRLGSVESDRLLATAQGNPFYLSELVTLLLERGALHRDRSGLWQLAPGSLTGRLLSRDLAAVLAARIDALPGPARAVLRDAAVVGELVPSEALAAVRADKSNLDVRPAAVVAIDTSRAIDELLHRRMLRPNRDGYIFATPLLRQAAYAGVGKADLASRHARLARWAAAKRAAQAPDSVLVTGLSWRVDTLDAFIADQSERARALADAVSLRPDALARKVTPLGVAALGRLARAALRAGEPAEAVALIDRATALASRRLPFPERLVHAGALLQLGRAEQALADATQISADAVGTVGTVDAAGTAGAVAGAPGWVGDDSAGSAEVAERALAFSRAQLLIGRCWRILGDVDRAIVAWESVLAVATEDWLPAERAEALRRIGMQDYLRGRLDQARDGFAEALAIADAAEDRRGQAWALHNLAWVATTLGDFEATDAALNRAARLFAQLRDPTGRAWVRGSAAFARLLSGRLSEARRLASSFLPFGERSGERWAVGTLRAVDAFASAELGALDAAELTAKAAYEEFEAIDDDWGRGLALAVLGVVARGRGLSREAVRLLTAAGEFGQATGHPLLQGIAGTVRGFAFLELGEVSLAMADARAVLAVLAEHTVGESVRVGPLVLLGLAQRASGDLDSAAATLAQAAPPGSGPPVLLSRRLVQAEYASVLLASGRSDAGLIAARTAVSWPAEDSRGRTVAERVLAAAYAAVGELDQARAHAEQARMLAYESELVTERDACDRLMEDLHRK